MTRFRSIVVLVPALASTLACSESSVIQDTEADRAAIRTFIERATNVNRSGDAAAWVAQFAEGAVYMPANGPEVSTRSGLQAVAERNFAQFLPQITITPIEVEVFGDWAFARTTVTGTLQPKAGGDVVTLDLKEIAVYRRQQDGGWKLWRLIGNSNRP
jgi:uncharacterized protein (TIGR02246 family)